MTEPIPGAPGQFVVADAELTDDERALIEWAEQDIQPEVNHPSSLHGADAAAHGRAVLEAALGGPETAERAMHGRPPLDPTARPGQHAPVRQVRLPASMNTELSERAAAEGRPASEIIREALAAYLNTHRAS
jgi:hypothetical protein